MKKKRIMSSILIACTAVVLLAAIFVILFARNRIELKRHSAKANIPALPVASCSDDDLQDMAKQLVLSLQNKEWDTLAAVVHPEFGLVFSPYPTVNLSTARCFTGSQIKTFQRDRELYIWGVYDGTGEPIELNVNDYLARFVSDAEFLSGTVAVNAVQHAGNALENLETVFEGARYVDFYVPDLAEENGMGWKSLHLVFEEYEGLLYLSAVIHSEYTV